LSRFRFFKLKPEMQTIQTKNMQYPKLAKLNLSGDSFFKQPGQDLKMYFPEHSNINKVKYSKSCLLWFLLCLKLLRTPRVISHTVGSYISRVTTFQQRSLLDIISRSCFTLILDVDECNRGSHTCHLNAVCNNTNGGYNCSCKKGYSGDGHNCTGIFLDGIIYRFSQG